MLKTNSKDKGKKHVDHTAPTTTLAINATFSIAKQIISLSTTNEVSMTPLVVRCSENRFALLTNISFDGIMNTDLVASEPILEDPISEHPLSDQVEVNEYTLKDAQLGMQIDDVV